MAELKRWDMVSDFPGSEEYMAEEPDGEFVKYTDTELLRRKAAAFDALERLVKENDIGIMDRSDDAAKCFLIWREPAFELSDADCIGEKETLVEAVEEATQREAG